MNTHKLIYVISAIAALAGLLFGYDTGIISGAILFIEKDFSLTSFQTEVVISAVLLGAIIGAFLSGKLTDTFGRKSLLIITAVIFIIGSLLSGLAVNFSYLVIGRMFLGIAIGMGSFIAPLYLAELAPPHIRGLLVSLNQVAITTGIMLSYLIDYYFSLSGDWKWMFFFGVFPALLLFIGALFLPESPRWLLLHGQPDKALNVLNSIRAPSIAQEELKAISTTINIEEKANWRLLMQKWVCSILVISVGLSFFQQVTGINTIIYYAPTILEMAGFQNASTAILATAGVGAVNVLFTIIALPLVDKWGRRPLLLIGLTGMCLSLILMGAAFHFPHLSQLRWIAVASMIIYIAMFAMSLGPVMWLIISEIFPLNVRGLGVSLAVAANWFFNMLVSLTFLTFINTLGASLTFFMYAILCFLAWIFVYKLVPETKECSLEEIENNLKAGKTSRNIGIAID